ncbi:hypothetical protein [Microbacterium sp. 1.5R]|uniref:hypothetical protein n=1 Tax=Microbacterium sp. 1.5R TaxID=1916917 RepID=UPI00119F4B2F|nr:hypothetical protein [Microbacterium sp. 1.5R]
MIGRALRMQANSLSGDIVLLWMLGAAFGMSLLIATGVPPELIAAPASERAALAAPLGTILAVYGAVLASVYGAFRYTVDRRDGVVAQRLMLQPRRAVLIGRIPSAAIGGMAVSAASVVGGHAALLAAMGGIPVEWSTLCRTLALGAVAGVYGLGVGLVVQSHLLALFIAPMSLGVALLVATVWPEGAAHLPLFAMLEALGFDLRAVGLAPSDRLAAPVAALLAGAWVVIGILGGGILFLVRDVR